MSGKTGFTLAATFGLLAAIAIPSLTKAADPTPKRANANGLATTASVAKPKKPLVTLTEVPVDRTEPLAGHAPSLLPAGKKWEMVWNDEFDGTKLDESKWNYRLHYWGYKSPTFTDEGVELDGNGHLKINLIRKGDDFVRRTFRRDR